METIEQIRDRILAQFPGAVEIVQNTSPSAQHSLLISDHGQAAAIATFLRDDEMLRLDYCSNVTGLDWPDKEIVETKKIPDPADPTKTIEQKTKTIRPGYLEAVYHLFSISKKNPLVTLRLRTADRAANNKLPSLTPVWRSCELQEREIFDLYGIDFENHPDLRRLLMWDEFEGHPMRKDYTEPDDYEWEPTAHGAVLEKNKNHRQAASSSTISTVAAQQAATDNMPPTTPSAA